MHISVLTVEALTANVVGFYSMVMHSVAILTDGGGETLEFLHFIYKDIQSFQSLKV